MDKHDLLSRFRDTHEFIWKPQRPERTVSEVKEYIGLMRSHELVVPPMTLEDRVQVRLLLYAVLGSEKYLDMFDGALLPPPYALPDATDIKWTADDIGTVVRAIDPALDVAIVLMPFNLATRVAAYDACLRAAARRLCWVLNMPFAVVECYEEAVGAIVVGETDVAKVRQMIEAEKAARKRSLRRAATIGGFAVFGSVLLLLAGSWAAPLIAPAYNTMLSGAITTIQGAGSIGAYVLGSSSVGAAVTYAATVASHVVALGQVVTPFLSPANLTVIFGVSGAALGAYNAYHRTDESADFALRSMEDVEAFSSSGDDSDGDSAAGGHDRSSESDRDGGDDAEKDDGDADAGSPTVAALQAEFDVENFVEESSQRGIVVPSHTRSTAMAHVSKMPLVKKRYRSIVFAVDCRLSGFELHLKSVKLLSGVWSLLPPAEITDGHSGIMACTNRYSRPTGSGFIVCYTASPAGIGAVGYTSLRVWVRVFHDFMDGWAFSSFCEFADADFDPFAAEYRLEETSVVGSYVDDALGVTAEMHKKPFTYIKLYLSEDQKKHGGRSGHIKAREFPQYLQECVYAHSGERRYIGLGVINHSSHKIRFKSVHIEQGEISSKTPAPREVRPKQASVVYVLNRNWVIDVSGYLILELENAEAAVGAATTSGAATLKTPPPPPPRRSHCVKIQFRVNSLNKVLLSIAAAPTAIELKLLALTATTQPSKFNVKSAEGLFFSMSVKTSASDNTVQITVTDAHAPRTTAAAAARVAPHASVTVGVCGYSDLFDPRRSTADQQVGLWHTIFRRTSVLGNSEAYALQWENEHLQNFSKLIQSDLGIADRLSKKAIKKVTKKMKKQVMRGVLFKWFNSYRSFVGVFYIPSFAIWAASAINNSFASLSNRAEFAGKTLALALLDPKRGRRPVTLVGFSFGSKVVFDCLCELARVGQNDLVENAFLIGGPFTADGAEWQRLRGVVAGRLVNAFTRSDWLLWLLHNVNNGSTKPMAGVTPVNVAGVENIDVTPLVRNHADYAAQLPDILERIGDTPSAESWTCQRAGAPGVVVHPLRCTSATKAIRRSLNSVFSYAAKFAFGVRNSIVCDWGADGARASTLHLAAYALFDCFFDFTPQPAVRACEANAFGVMGDTDDAPLGGVLAYTTDLRGHAEHELLVLVYFYTEDLHATAAVSAEVVPRAAECDAAAFAAQVQRKVNLAASRVSDVRRRCAELVVVQHAGRQSSAQTVELPLTHTFLDLASTAVFHVECQRISGAIMLDVLALLSNASTAAERLDFNEGVFLSEYAAAGWEAHSVLAPRVAATRARDELQGDLMNVAMLLTSHTMRPAAASLTPVVIVNCSPTLPLYFGVDLDLTDDVDEVKNSEVGAGDLLWVWFPPPVLPPNSFAVLLLGDVHEARVPTFRYATEKSRCGFDVRLRCCDAGDGGAQPHRATVTCAPAEDMPLRGDCNASSTPLSGVAFSIVTMVPADAASNPLLSDVACMREAMKEYGWAVF